MRYVRVECRHYLECEFCAGKLDDGLVCCEPDCFADMQFHWEMTNPAQLERAMLMVQLGTLYLTVQEREAFVRDLPHFFNEPKMLAA